jgi:hypothetical protein
VRFVDILICEKSSDCKRLLDVIHPFTLGIASSTVQLVNIMCNLFNRTRVVGYPYVVPLAMLGAIQILNAHHRSYWWRGRSLKEVSCYPRHLQGRGWLGVGFGRWPRSSRTGSLMRRTGPSKMWGYRGQIWSGGALSDGRRRLPHLVASSSGRRTSGVRFSAVVG